MKTMPFLLAVFVTLSFFEVAEAANPLKGTVTCSGDDPVYTNVVISSEGANNIKIDGGTSNNEEGTHHTFNFLADSRNSSQIKFDSSGNLQKINAQGTWISESSGYRFDAGKGTLALDLSNGGATIRVSSRDGMIVDTRLDRCRTDGAAQNASIQNTVSVSEEAQ